jgi:hypothetical protein
MVLGPAEIDARYLTSNLWVSTDPVSYNGTIEIREIDPT